MTINVQAENATGVKNEFYGESANRNVSAPPAPHQIPIEAESYANTVEIEDINVEPSQPDLYGKISKREVVYPIRKKKGYILIINVTFAGEETERKGSSKDVYRMKTLWESMGYKVIVKTKSNETTAEEIQTVVRSLSTNPKYAGSSLLGVFVMSHGNRLKNGQEYFKTSDKKKIYTEDIITMLDNKNSVKLQNIPKLFFFQMCRGSERDRGVDEDDDSIEGLFNLLSIDDNDQEDADPPSKLPTRSDTMISHASLSGYKCFRIPTEGSWFINAIANVFQKHAHNEDILRLMTRVNDAVSAKIISSKDPEKDQYKQMSETRFTLRKALYLFPGATI